MNQPIPIDLHQIQASGDHYALLCFLWLTKYNWIERYRLAHKTDTSLCVSNPMWAVPSAFLFLKYYCVCLKCYGPNVVLLYGSVPVDLYYLPVWAFRESIYNLLHCITYYLQATYTHTWPSVEHVELQESARCKYRTHDVWVTIWMYASPAGDNGLRCRHHLPLRLNLPLSLVPYCSSHQEWGPYQLCGLQY
jgi:hypothetical protein